MWRFSMPGTLLSTLKNNSWIFIRPTRGLDRPSLDSNVDTEDRNGASRERWAVSIGSKAVPRVPSPTPSIGGRGDRERGRHSHGRGPGTQPAGRAFFLSPFSSGAPATCPTLSLHGPLEAGSLRRKLRQGAAQLGFARASCALLRGLAAFASAASRTPGPSGWAVTWEQ